MQVFEVKQAVYNFVGVEARGKGGSTPLHLACTRESSSVGRYPICVFPSLPAISLLLECGADPNSTDYVSVFSMWQIPCILMLMAGARISPKWILLWNCKKGKIPVKCCRTRIKIIRIQSKRNKFIFKNLNFLLKLPIFQLNQIYMHLFSWQFVHAIMIGSLFKLFFRSGKIIRKFQIRHTEISTGTGNNQILFLFLFVKTSFL